MIEKLNNTEGVKQSQSAAGQRELLREYRNRLNEVIDSVNDHEDMLYGCGCDNDDDVCPDCGNWDDDHKPNIPYTMIIDEDDEETFTPHLFTFSTEQLRAIRDEAEGELERRSQEAMKGDDDDLCPDCRATHGLLADLTHLSDDELEEVRGQVEVLREARAQVDMMKDDDGERLYNSTLKEKPLFKQVDTTDGLFSDFTAYVAAHPGLRFYQVLTIFSGYKKLYGEDKDGELTDLFYQKSRKGSRS